MSLDHLPITLGASRKQVEKIVQALAALQEPEQGPDEVLDPCNATTLKELLEAALAKHKHDCFSYHDVQG